ncbi:MAG TPA: hypothetical protein VMW47_02605 [Verrucomicrobiae bacterium]|nr:hypothetical protein [Verrucomicrobiae bacterium]
MTPTTAREHARGARPPVAAPTIAAPTVAAAVTPTATAAPAPTSAVSPAAPGRPSPAPDGKGEPTSGPPAPIGYAYPVDASGDVRAAALQLVPTRVAASAGPVQIRVRAAGHSWVPGQAIFVFVGQRFAIRITGPGAAGTLTVPASLLTPPSLVVSGFQFPQNSPAAPVDGAATADLVVTG